MSRPLRVLVAEDVDLVAEAFVALLNGFPELTVVARVGRGDVVAAAALEHRPDIALLDVDMPGASGIEAAAELRAVLPGCRSILLTSLEGEGHVHKALDAGASGYLLKSTTADSLLAALLAVHAGRVVIDPQLAVSALRAGPNPLSEREIEILRLVGVGCSTAQIAGELHLTRGTVRNTVSKAMTKLDAETRVGAYRCAQRRGLL